MSQGRSCSLFLCPSCSLWLLLSALGCCSQQLLWQQQRAGSAEGRGDRLWWWRCWLWELVWVVDKSGTHGPCYGSGHANILFAGWWWCPSWKNSDATYTCCWGVWRLGFTLGGLVLRLDGWWMCCGISGALWSSNWRQLIAGMACCGWSKLKWQKVILLVLSIPVWGKVQCFN